MMDLTLIPKVSAPEQQAEVLSCHVKFDFLDHVNHETMSTIMDKALRELYIKPGM